MRKVNFNDLLPCDQKLIKMVCDELDVKLYQLTFVSRFAEYDNVKFICYQVLTLAGFSSTNIGARFNRDHSTVLYGARKVTDDDRLSFIANKIAYKLYPDKVKPDLQTMVWEVKNMLNKRTPKEEISKKLGKDLTFIDFLCREVDKQFHKRKAPDYKKSEVFIQYY